MRTCLMLLALNAMFISSTPTSARQASSSQPVDEREQSIDDRLDWWREARFGMFIHWGLYAVPAGRWDGQPVNGVGEWIQYFAQIPAAEYEPLVPQFNPVKFDADEWARLAADAGMKYLVITTKHHDGFALFDSVVSDYDIMATPFQRDIMAELSEACRRHGVRIGWYHSILDWHHPDYLPMRPWDRAHADEADFDRYREYLRQQVTEILTNYGDIDIMWFDGEWEATWTHEDGVQMYNMVRSLQPDIIVNNRVDTGRHGMAGMTREGEFVGDFGTPEQEIPATGIPGEDWETCMTMNDTWGFKIDDDHWKSTETLLRNLTDIVSKGGNFLLNVGPTAEGEIPAPSIERLRAMGDWLDVNGESIYGTTASPFVSLPWGRCTVRDLEDGGTRLYLHVFDWPEGGALRVPGLANAPRAAFLLSDPSTQPLNTTRDDDAVVITVPGRAPDPINTVIALDIEGRPKVFEPPMIHCAYPEFVGRTTIKFDSAGDGLQVRYTTDGRTPTVASPLAPGELDVRESTTITARLFRNRQPVSGERRLTVRKVDPLPAVQTDETASGVRFAYYEHDCNSVLDLLEQTPVVTGVADAIDLSPRQREEHFGFRFTGLIRIPSDGMYRLTLSSDDGGLLRIAGRTVVDHDGLHVATEKSGLIPLARGLHEIEVLFFEKTGDQALEVFIEGPDLTRREVSSSMLRHATR